MNINFFILTSYATSAKEWISSSSWVTRTFRLVVDASTRGILGTRVWPTHGLTCLTEEVTCLVLTTVVINPTLNIYTCHQGVALESDRTYTACLVELRK